MFLRVYERRGKFHYLIKKSIHGKNKEISDLSSCVIQKFNGYEVMKKKSEIQRKKKHFEPVDIFYEAVIDDSAIKCFLQTVFISIQRLYRQKHEVDCRL